jgi:hypothetical protein
MIFAGAHADLVGAADAPGGHLVAGLGQEGLGGGQQVLAGAGAVGGQQRVAAGDQPLGGVVRAGDLREVLLVKEAELQRAGELADRRGPAGR